MLVAAPLSITTWDVEGIAPEPAVGVMLVAGEGCGVAVMPAAGVGVDAEWVGVAVTPIVGEGVTGTGV